MNWHVIYTRSRNEKVVAKKLQQCGIEVFCPLLKTKKRWSDRWKWVEEPLFRSYCFVKIEDKNRPAVFSVSGVVSYLYHCGKPAIIRDEEMQTLQNWIASYDHEMITVSNFSTNDKILIRSGAFADKEAEVIESQGNHIILLLRDLNLKIKIDLRSNLVEKLNLC